MNFKKYFQKITHPQFYLGKTGGGNYFEGWYFKQEIGDICYSFIAGIYIGLDSHSFIQVIRHDAGMESRYFRFSLEEFSAKEDELFIKIGDNVFSSKGIQLYLKHGEYRLVCDISFGHFAGTPNAMGIFSLIPNLQCNHVIVSMAHTLRGKITENKKEISFDNGLGYIEKDFGTAFPEKYIWMQANLSNELVLSFARATVPVGRRTIDGHICFIKHGDRLFNLSTYAFGRVCCCKYVDNKFIFDVQRGTLKLSAELECENAMPLKAPEAGGMVRTINEGLCCKAKMDFTDGKKNLYSGEGLAAFEHIIRETIE